MCAWVVGQQDAAPPCRERTHREAAEQHDGGLAVQRERAGEDADFEEV